MRYRHQGCRNASWALKENPDSQASVEVRLRTTIVNRGTDNGGKPADFDALEVHYIETAAGQRFDETKGLLGSKVVFRHQDFSDGDKAAHVEFPREAMDKQSTVSIDRSYWQEDTSDRRNAPAHLQFLYVGRKPLAGALASSEYLGETKVLDRTCDQYLFRQVRW